MRAVPKSIRTFLIHLLTWVAFAIYEQVIVLLTDASQFHLLRMVPLYLANAAVFYGNSEVLLPRFYARRAYGRYAGAAALLLLAYVLLRTGLNEHLLAPDGTPAVAYQSMWVNILYRGSFFLFVSIGYWFSRQTILLAIQKRQQEALLRVAERDLLEANLAFLKSQINPHFLFNSLNFLYAQVYPHSENAAKGILLLADTMRYALQEDSNGKVMLAQEVQHLENYISLNQLRFNNQLWIVFELNGPTHFLMIMPLVLITFVENCFKHGELADAADPILIRMTVVHNQLTFYTRNRKRTGPKEKSTGIGLTNTRKRLALMYPDRHTLRVDDGTTHYTCNLNIEL